MSESRPALLALSAGYKARLRSATMPPNPYKSVLMKAAYERGFEAASERLEKKKEKSQ